VNWRLESVELVARRTAGALLPMFEHVPQLFDRVMAIRETATLATASRGSSRGKTPADRVRG
jgi:hypothetical protein